MTGSLASVHPELIPEWSEKNLPLTPDKITFGSNKRVWWKGACGHEWETSVKARSKGEKCPICSGARVIEGINDLATLKPLLAQEWSKKNKLKPTEVSVASHMKDFDVFIAQDGQTYRYLINNANFESYIKVVKVDAESGKNIPYAGAGFKIFDPNGNQVIMTFTYPTPTTIDTFYTDANGQLVTPEKLEYGKGYSLVEVQAPYGYVLDSTPVYFDVAEEHSSDEGGIPVIKVDKPNMAQKGTVSIEKTGEVFSGVNISGEENADVIYQPVYEVKGLAGAVYEIAAAEDIITPDGTLRYANGEVVDTVTTDENGLAKSKELYLGRYTVVEITAPEGMVINKEAHEVELTYAGQEVAVTETATSFVNERQKFDAYMDKAEKV